MIYDRIKEICKKKGLTITGLEKELGFARGSLIKIDKNKPSAAKVSALANRLSVSESFLMTGEEPTGYYLNDETASIAQEIFENKELRALFDASRNATPEDLSALHAMALALKRKEHYED